jgi:hypothetical protein
VGYAIYFAADSASVYATTPVLQGSANVTPGQTVPVAGSTILLSDTLFNRTQIWVGVQINATANAGPPVDGKVKVTQLTLRIVLASKFF